MEFIAELVGYITIYDNYYLLLRDSLHSETYKVKESLRGANISRARKNLVSFKKAQPSGFF